MHREIAEYRREVEKCVAQKRTLRGEEQKLYMEYLSKVELAYAQLNVSTQYKYEKKIF